MKPPIIIEKGRPPAREGYYQMTYQLVGLGDVVALLTGLVGLHPVGNCGCNARRKALNHWQVPIIYF